MWLRGPGVKGAASHLQGQDGWAESEADSEGWGWLCVSLPPSATPWWSPTGIPSSDLPVPDREKPKRIRFGAFYRHCSFREEPVTEGNCKDTFTPITYVFTELTKLPNQLLHWALELCVSMCAHSFSPYRCCFPYARKTVQLLRCHFCITSLYTLIESFSSASFLLKEKRHF